jgi:hypothetical protein
MTSTLQQDCPHTRVEPRGLLSSIEEGLESLRPWDSRPHHETGSAGSATNSCDASPGVSEWTAFLAAKRA